MNYLNMLKRPVVLGVLALVLGLILGLMIGWVVMPVEWYDAPVKLLRSDLQEEYLRMSIDSFRVNNDETLALKRYADLGENAPDLVRTVKANPGKIDPNFITQWEQMLTRNKVLSPTKEEPITAPSGASALVSIMIIVGALIGIGLVLAAGFFSLSGRTPFRSNYPSSTCS